MKRSYFWVVASLMVLIASPLLLEQVKKDTGYILINLGDTTLETSFWFGLLAVFITLLLLWWFYKIVRAILRSFGLSWAFLSESRTRQFTNRTNRGLIHYIEGNWQAAKKDLLSVVKHAPQPLVHYLAAAHSAHQLGDLETCQELLSQAEKIAPENELAILLSQARMQFSARQYEQCLATLERVRKSAPHHPVVLELLRQVYVKVGDWRSLVELVPVLKKYGQLDTQQIQQLEIEANKTLLANRRANLQELTEHWQKLPKALKQQAAMVMQYAQMLLEFSMPEKAELILRNALNKHWDKTLVELYGRVPSASVSEQLVTAEQWKRERPGDPELLLALARISMRNKLWGKARAYYEGSLQLQAKPETCAELAALLAQLGDHQKSTELYQQGLLLITRQNNS